MSDPRSSGQVLDGCRRRQPVPVDQAREHGISAADVVQNIMLKPMPKGVFISFEELAGTCQFLLEPAARNITGQTLVLDGGWTVA